MSAAILLDELLDRDIRLIPQGDRLRVDAPAGLLGTPERAVLAANKYALLGVLARDEPEVSWRAEAMHRQVQRAGPLPLLVARPGRFSPGTCVSCGEPVEARTAGPSYRCGPCARAAWLVLDDLTRVTRKA